MKNLYDKLIEDEEKKIFILDNLSAHLTGEIFEYYKKKGIKILFNNPYLSKFNMIKYIGFAVLKILLTKKITRILMNSKMKLIFLLMMVIWKCI